MRQSNSRASLVIVPSTSSTFLVPAISCPTKTRVCNCSALRLNCWTIHIFQYTTCFVSDQHRQPTSSEEKASTSNASTLGAPTVRFPSLNGAAISERIFSSKGKYLLLLKHLSIEEVLHASHPSCNTNSHG